MTGDDLDTFEPGPRSDPSIVVFLSLYLLLLAFFILMNSISEQQAERAKAAMASVNAEFNAPRPADAVQVAQSLAQGVTLGADQIQTRIRRVFETAISVARYEFNEDTNQMSITVPADRLFEPGRATLLRTRTGLFRAVAKAMTDRQRGKRYGMEVLFGSGATLPDAANPGRILQIQRAGMVARDFRERGVAAESIAIGLHRGDPREVTFVFVPEREFESRPGLFRSLGG
ncbi:flagellar motor protein MotB [Oceanibacterium hippocampi]|uniref:Flagellar motor protein MotD n=1 Tax=Oceanibacterium hippocampi TaxID=745714 RepID=A0A1Y5TZ20_9PROT|nr:flagellar motor protein MotB [Oceanibacterium hippocampi]SLN77125.1 flagellar motor protein MotD [Oceanibacterium hippocampi]